jgi:hypothetical protein
MAGGASADPPPAWLIVITVAVFLGFFIAYNNDLPTASFQAFPDDCGLLYVDCIATVFIDVGIILILLFTIITLGGFSSPLPVLIQAPLFFFFAITWGIIIVKMITNTAGAVIP